MYLTRLLLDPVESCMNVCVRREQARITIILVRLMLQKKTGSGDPACGNKP